jgi:uncharacterized protein (TIGR02453 family)
MLMQFNGFPRDGLAFLGDLAAHNDRAWFAAHKQEYQATLLEPAQAFVGVLGERLRALAPGIRADPRTDGRGTLMRLSRDTRFSDDKTPTKPSSVACSGKVTARKPRAQRLGFGSRQTAWT